MCVKPQSQVICVVAMQLLWYLLKHDKVSDPFQSVLTSYDLFQVVPLFTSDGVTESFGMQNYYQSTSYGFCYKGGSTVQHVYFITSGTTLIYYEIGQVLLQSEEAFLYYKAEQLVRHSRGNMTIWSKYHKVTQFLQRSVAHKTDKTGKGNRIWQPTP